jgi:hypothetical protein
MKLSDISGWMLLQLLLTLSLQGGDCQWSAGSALFLYIEIIWATSQTRCSALEYQFYFCLLQPLWFPFASKVFHEEDQHSGFESETLLLVSSHFLIQFTSLVTSSLTVRLSPMVTEQERNWLDLENSSSCSRSFLSKPGSAASNQCRYQM